jgi:hypothetical protein
MTLIRTGRRTLGAMLSLAMLMTLGFTVVARAAVPQKLHYQGILLDNAGAPVSTPVTVTFRIYPVASGGSALWTEGQSVTPDASGVFSVLLGNTTPIPSSVFDAADRWLGLTVGADPEMSPRASLVSTPYAFRVASVAGAAGGVIQGPVAVGDSTLGACQGTSVLTTWGNLVVNGDGRVNCGELVVASPTFPGRSWTMSSQGRQEMTATNDFIIQAASNIQLWPSTASTSAAFSVASAGGGTVALAVYPSTHATAPNRVGIGGSHLPTDALDVDGTISIRQGGPVVGRFLMCNTAGGRAVWGVPPSDARLKKDIEPLEGALAKVAALRPVSFHWRQEEFPDRGFGGQRELGLIAQEAEMVTPEIVSENPDGYLGVNYVALVPLLIEAIKEQQALIDSQGQELAQLKDHMANLQASVAAGATGGLVTASMTAAVTGGN